VVFSWRVNRPGPPGRGRAGGGADFWRERTVVHGESKWPDSRRVSISRDPQISGAGPRPIRRLLRALPRPVRGWGRHDCAARVRPPAVVSLGAVARGPGGAFL